MGNTRDMEEEEMGFNFYGKWKSSSFCDIQSSSKGEMFVTHNDPVYEEIGGLASKKWRSRDKCYERKKLTNMNTKEQVNVVLTPVRKMAIANNLVCLTLMKR